MGLRSTLANDENKLLSDGRIAGPMPWVIAIMVFLTILAAAAGVSMYKGATQSSDLLARKMTVQILEDDPSTRVNQRDQVTQYLRKLPQVRSVKPLSDQEVGQLLEPWLGEQQDLSNANDDLIPLPVIIDVDMKKAVDAEAAKTLTQNLRNIAPSVRADTQESWIAPLNDFMRGLIVLIIGLVILLAAATSATVVLAVRSALDTHRTTLDIMHLMGSTDQQISKLFQRRVAVDALFGGALGFIVGCIIIVTISSQVSGLSSDIISQISLPWYGWIILMMIPLLMAGLAIYMARWTVRRVMKKIL